MKKEQRPILADFIWKSDCWCLNEKICQKLVWVGHILTRVENIDEVAGDGVLGGHRIAVSDVLGLPSVVRPSDNCSIWAFSWQ